MKNLRFKERLKDLKRLKEEKVFRLCFDIFFSSGVQNFTLRGGPKCLWFETFYPKDVVCQLEGVPRKCQHSVNYRGKKKLT